MQCGMTDTVRNINTAQGGAGPCPRGILEAADAGAMGCCPGNVAVAGRLFRVGVGGDEAAGARGVEVRGADLYVGLFLL